MTYFIILIPEILVHVLILDLTHTRVKNADCKKPQRSPIFFEMISVEDVF